MNKLAVARIAPPTINGSAKPAPVFGIVVPRTLDELLGAGAVDSDAPGDADAEALGDAGVDVPGSGAPPPDEPDGDGDAVAEELGEVCA